jgi:hypothetical protein
MATTIDRPDNDQTTTATIGIVIAIIAAAMLALWVFGAFDTQPTMTPGATDAPTPATESPSRGYGTDETTQQPTPPPPRQ